MTPDPETGKWLLFMMGVAVWWGITFIIYLRIFK